MANALGFDYGNVVRNIESIKTVRAQREGTDLGNVKARNTITRVGRADERSENALSLRQGFVGGDESALSGLVALNPKEAEDFMSAIANMDATQRRELDRGIDMMGKIAASILSASDPAAAYTAAIAALPVA